MGIYYYAVDEAKKLQIWAPKHFADKSPGCFHPKNPLPNMVFMMNTRGYNFVVTNDFQSFHDEEIYKDITDEVYQDFKSMFEHYDWDTYEKNMTKKDPFEGLTTEFGCISPVVFAKATQVDQNGLVNNR